MARSTKPKLPTRDFVGAKPLRYVNGRLYYVANEMIDKIKSIPSQQCHKKPVVVAPEAV
jgi:hypothetical protein